MERYIRTESGLIADRLFPSHCFRTHGSKGRYVNRSLENAEDLDLWLEYKHTSVIARADAVHKLFDEVVRVVHYTKAKPSFVRPLPGDWEERGKDAYEKEMEKCLEQQRQMKLRGDDFDLYGAVWTDKGLTYVAKMNEEGGWSRYGENPNLG